MRTWAAAVAFAAAVLADAAGAHAQTATSGRDPPGETTPVPPTATPVVTPERLAAEEEIKTLRAGIQRLITAGDMAGAERAAREALARAEALFDARDGWIGLSADTLGQILLRLGRPAEAAVQLLRALEIASIYLPPGHDRYKGAVGNLVDALVAMKAGEDAKQLYTRIIEGVAGKPDQQLVEAYYRFELGSLLRRIGEPAAAEREFRLTLDLRRAALPADHFDIASTLTQIAGLMRIGGRFKEAQDLYLEAIAITRRVKGDEDPNVGIMLDNLGTVYGELGLLTEAERVQRQAIAIFESKLGPDHISTATGFANLATLYQRLGRQPEALRLFEQALAIYGKRLPRDDARTATAMDNLASLYRETGERQRALELRREALRIFLAVYPEKHLQVATATHNLALSEEDAGNQDVAEQLYQRSIAIGTALFGARHHSLGVTYANLGELQFARGRLADAYRSHLTAVTLLAEGLGSEHRLLIAPLRSLAGISLGLKRFDEALDFSRRAMRAELASRRRETREPAASGARGAGDGPLYGAMTVAWRALDAGSGDTDALTAEAFETAQWVTLSAAGRSLAALGARLAARDPALGDLVRTRQDLAGEWARVDKAIVAALALPPPRREAAREAQLRERLASIEARLSAIDARLAREFTAFTALSDPRPIGLATVRGLLKADEALVQIVTAGEFSHVFVVTTQGAVWRRLPVGWTDLAKRIDTLRCGLDPARWVGEAALRCLDHLGRGPESGLLPFDGATAHKLWQDLLAPFADQLVGRRLLVAASGPVSRLPLHVLLTEPADTATLEGLAAAPWLARRHAIVVLPSVASLETLRARPAASRATRRYLGIANPILLGADGQDRRAGERLVCPAPATRGAGLLADATGSLPVAASLVRGGAVDVSLVRTLAPLPETTDEVCAVARGLGGDLARDLLLGPAATEERIKAASRSGDLAGYRVLHFATHGLVSGELAGLTEPGLVLTPPSAPTADDDGVLTASEIAALSLDADAVVLSACNTAAGDAGGESDGGEALSGLARAFFYAGSRSLLVSHWPVASDAAVSLVTRGFELLIGEPGLGRAEALRRSMLAMIERPNAGIDAHPQIWAPFVVVGEDAPGDGWPPASLAAPTDAPAPVPASLPSAVPASGAPKPPAVDDAVARAKLVPRGPATKPAARRVGETPGRPLRRADPEPSPFQSRN